MHAQRSKIETLNIFFDLDGPILDVSERYFRVHQDIIERHGGKSMDKATYWQLKRDRQPLSALLTMAGCSNIEEAYHAEWFRNIESLEYLRYDIVIPGAREQLDSLRQHHFLVLVTLRQRRDYLDIQLGQLDLGRFFSAVFSTDPTAVEGWKAKRNLISESGFFSRDALIVGDTEIDVRAAKSLGLTTVAVLSGIRNRKRLAEEGADHIVRDINALWHMVSGD